MNILAKIALNFQLVAAIVGVTLGMLVFLKNKASSLNRIFFFLCFSVAIWYVGYYMMQTSGNQLFWAKLGHTGPIWAPIFFTHFTFSYLNIRRPVLLSSYYCLGGISSLCNIFSQGYFLGFLKYSWGVYPRGGIVTLIDFFVLILITTYNLSLLLNNLKKSQSKPLVEYNRVKYMTLAIGFFPIAGIDYLPKYNINIYPIGFIPYLIFTGMISFGILKYQVFDISVVIRKGLVYSIIAAIITALFFSTFLIIEKFFQGMLGYQSMLVTALAGFIMALGFIPLRNQIQRFIDRIFFKKSPQEIEAENIRLKEELERSQRLRSIGTLAAGMAHEIKNPLTSIKTFTEYLPKEYDKPEFREKFQRIVGAEVERIDNIVKNILSFSKPRELKEEDVDIPKALDEILELLNNELLRHKINVHRNYCSNEEIRLNADSRRSNADSRQCAEKSHLRASALDSRPSAFKDNIFIKGDYNQLKQAFLNIILNSIDAMPHGGDLTISASLKTKDQRQKTGNESLRSSVFGLRSDASDIEVTIEDTGVGISKADLKHIFDPFFSRKDEGTGLGLAVVHGIIERHHGKIEVESELGKGTKFSIKFPIR